MLFIAYRSRSSQIAAAARFLALSWLFGLQLWISLSEPQISIALAIIDLALACAFLEMSRRRWFPVPLFFLHAMLVLYHLYAVLVGSAWIWIVIVLNRAFELAIFYVIACAAYRIYVVRDSVAR